MASSSVANMSSLWSSLYWSVISLQLELYSKMVFVTSLKVARHTLNQPKEPIKASSITADAS